jgi:hypothetical protein
VTSHIELGQAEDHRAGTSWASHPRVERVVVAGTHAEAQVRYHPSRAGRGWTQVQIVDLDEAEVAFEVNGVPPASTCAPSSHAEESNVP